MRQLGVIAVPNANPKLTHGAELLTNHSVAALETRSACRAGYRPAAAHRAALCSDSAPHLAERIDTKKLLLQTLYVSGNVVHRRTGHRGDRFHLPLARGHGRLDLRFAKVGCGEILDPHGLGHSGGRRARRAMAGLA